MDSVLRGKEVVLRPLCEKDMRARSQISADRELGRMMGGATDEKTMDADEAYRSHCEWLRRRHLSGAAPYAIEVDNRCIGDIDFGLYPAERKADLTVCLWQRQERGKGYGAEAVELIIAEMFRDKRIDFIEVDVHQENAPALSFWTKLGFSLVSINDKGTRFMQRRRHKR